MLVILSVKGLAMAYIIHHFWPYLTIHNKDRPWLLNEVAEASKQSDEAELIGESHHLNQQWDQLLPGE